MKRLKWVFLLCLALLALTGGAAAAEITSIRVYGNTVSAVVLAETDCTLMAALYDDTGVLVDVNTAPVSGQGEYVEMSVELGTGIPSGGYARGYLVDTETLRPLCECMKRFIPAVDVYAIQYADGEMVFQHGDTPEAGREVTATYPVNLEYGYYDYEEQRRPWPASPVQKVRFAEKIQPVRTALWFSNCTNLTEIENIENLDTSHVEDMSHMFDTCMKLTELDLSSFDTSSLKSMVSMFFNCAGLTTLNLSGWDTSHVEGFGMYAMFARCRSLTELDVSGFDTSGVTGVASLFSGCQSLTSLDLSGWDTSNVTDMGGMFDECKSLTALNLSGWDTSCVTSMRSMFYGCGNLAELDLSSFDTSSVTNMSALCGNCGLTALDLSNFDTSHVTYMAAMFENCKNLTELDLSNFDTSNVTDMNGMFQGCTGLTALNLHGWNTSSVTNMGYMFRDCRILPELDLSGFDTSSLNLMDCMFLDCFSLTTVYASASFVTDAVYDSMGAFTNCIHLVGGAGTAYDETHNDAEYARIDGGASAPGYFTLKTA